jgi:general secretion pathway protein B
MSYILDALKKSEKERQRAVVPDVLTVQELRSQAQKKRVWWPYLLLAALVINAGLLVWWLNPLQSEKTRAPEHSAVNEYHDTVKTVIQGTAASEKQAVPSEKQAVPSEKQAVPKDDVRQPKSEPIKADAVQKSASNTGIAVQKNVAVSVPHVEIGKPKEADVPKTLKTGMPVQNKIVPPVRVETEKPVEAAVPKPQTPPVISKSPTEPKTETATVVDNKVYSLAELPVAVQEGLPAFSISAHVYSSDPASRMVKINGQTMREGDTLAAGLKLEEIAPDGVIFRYETYRFRVGLR